MRITDSSTMLSNWQHLQSHKENQDRLQQQLSSGKRINVDSDDPIAANEIQNLRRQMAYLDRYGDNASRTDGLLKFTDSTLVAVSEVLLRVIDTGGQGTSSVVTTEARKNLANQIRSMKSELVALANTRYQGEYIFAGSKNLTQPFVVDSVTGMVTYAGNTDIRSVPIAEGIEIQGGISGQSLFMDKTDLFAALDNMASAVQAGDGSAVMSQMSEVEKARQAVSEARGLLGQQMQSVEQSLQQIARTREQLLERISNLEDADIGEVVGKLTLSQTAISATLYAQGTIGRRSLFDFIG